MPSKSESETQDTLKHLQNQIDRLQTLSTELVLENRRLHERLRKMRHALSALLAVWSET